MTELIKFDDSNTELATKDDDESFDMVSGAASFLPRLQLMTANSAKCKSGDFSINHWALVKGKNFEDLTEAVDVLLIAYRPKAMRIGEGVDTYHNPKNPEFARIQQDSDADNTEDTCMYGPEFLVWIPSIKTFATYFMCGKTARNESPNVKQRMLEAATLKSQEIVTKKFTYYSVAVSDCSVEFELPDHAEAAEKRLEFKTAKDSESETIEESEGDERAR